MLDKDLATLYKVETKQLTRQVRRNTERFPEDFMFQLTAEELRNLKCHFGTSSWGGTRKLPYAFTEPGIAMLSSVLNSNRAVQVNIQIIRTFIKLRELLLTHEDLRRKIEAMEEELVGNPTEKTLKQIHYLKKEMIFLRRSVWPLRELISGMERSESPLIKETTDAYLRDLYDHSIQVIDTIEGFRDMVTGLLDVYLSNASNRMNEIMQFLTIIGTIFIPLTFIAGIYGMNFDRMPELHWQWGYFIVLVLMFVVGAALVLYFRKRRWL